MLITAIIPHFHAARVQNLSPIVSSLQWNGVNRVLIWNNDAPIEPVWGAEIVQSAKNLGCQGRFAAVRLLSSDTTHVLFCDNDIIAPDGTVAILADKSRKHPQSLISAKWGYRYYGVDRICISFGQFELAPLPIVNRLLETWSYDPNLIFDDMWLSVRAHQLGITIQRIPTMLTTDERGVGFRYSSERRSAQKVFREMMSRQL